jgi:hypothetical protein
MNRELDVGENEVVVQVKKPAIQIRPDPSQAVEKQESGPQTRCAAMQEAQHIQAYASIGESHVTLDGGLGRSFSTICQMRCRLWRM